MFAIKPRGAGWFVGREDGDSVNSLSYEEATFAMRALEKRAWDISIAKQAQHKFDNDMSENK